MELPIKKRISGKFSKMCAATEKAQVMPTKSNQEVQSNILLWSNR